jgi:hypothetical protein
MEWTECTLMPELATRTPWTRTCRLSNPVWARAHPWFTHLYARCTVWALLAVKVVFAIPRDCLSLLVPSGSALVVLTERGGASSIMCSYVTAVPNPLYIMLCLRVEHYSRELLCSYIACRYNSVNGIPSCANGDILTTKARLEWGFEGYITSDWCVRVCS